jgi:transcriptional regulator with XRE-family HTH domain
MAKIEGETLRYLRGIQGWTLERLAKVARINKQTIWRIENGDKIRTQDRVIRQIASALNVDIAVLTGEIPIPKSSKEGELRAAKSQVSLRLTNSHRNALNLVALRYGVKAARIIELAPFLFFCAAETSLQNRKERLEQFEQVLANAEKIGDAFRHLPSINYFPLSDEAIDAERESISRRDLFGEQVELSYLGAESKFDGKCNPFAVHLHCMASQLGEKATFEEWDGQALPHYRICIEEAAALVDGAPERAEEILSGQIGLHDIPQEFRKTEQVRERTQWVQEKAQEYREQLERDFNDLLALLEEGEPDALRSDEPTEL